jgi:glycosyltransferase involved in cell wall biosynthesis
LPGTHTVISTCVDTNLFAFNESLPDSPIALLSGTYNEIYNAELISKFLLHVSSKFGHKIVWARGYESKSSFNLFNLAVVRKLTYSDMAKTISDSSYGIAVCRNDLGVSLSAAMPTKIAEFLAVGRPVIVNSNLGDVKEILARKNVAIILDNESQIEQAGKQLLSILSDPQTPYRCREVAEQSLSLQKAAFQYSLVYSGVKKSD